MLQDVGVASSLVAFKGGLDTFLEKSPSRITKDDGSMPPPYSRGATLECQMHGRGEQNSGFLLFCVFPVTFGGLL